MQSFYYIFRQLWTFEMLMLRRIWHFVGIAADTQYGDSLFAAPEANLAMNTWLEILDVPMAGD